MADLAPREQGTAIMAALRGVRALDAAAIFM